MREQTADVGRGIRLVYEVIGEGEPMVLVAGLGQQLHSWPTAFCERLAACGYAVVRFDNRDAGGSTHLPFPPPSQAAILTRRWSPDQYDLVDMAVDTVGLLDVLGYQDAHLVGVSMGGMIAQTVAALCPDRVRTLTSIMSTTGARGVGQPALSTWLRMVGRLPRTRQQAVDRAVRVFRHIGSHGFPFDEAVIQELAGTAWDRDPSSAGECRQLAAIFHSGDRTDQLRPITVPTLVIHGDRDRMVHPSGALATVRAIPGARLKTVPGMGHDLPVGAWPTLLDLVDAHARAEVPAEPGSDRLRAEVRADRIPDRLPG
jgi:pimeloyl-ACP methyl ester carboxylesterase